MELKFEHVDLTYQPGSPMEEVALVDISFELKENSFTALVGHTGSGKSTLLQNFNALLKPTAGKISIAGYEITPETTNKNLKELRHKVGMVFQFPENQLFEETVLRDIAFGPKNFGVPEEEANALAERWLKKVGLPEEVAEQTTFDLSGGQMRRVAIAGVLASEPDVLLLDEPAAGLDPAGRSEMMKIFTDYQKTGHTVILITHNMDDVAYYADDVLVLEQGRLLMHDTPQKVFADRDWLREHHLDEPIASNYASVLEQKGYTFDQNPLTLTDLTNAIKKNLNKG